MDVLNQGLGVMDSTATSLSMDNHIRFWYLRFPTPKIFTALLTAKKIGTIVEEVK